VWVTESMTVAQCPSKLPLHGSPLRVLVRPRVSSGMGVSVSSGMDTLRVALDTSYRRVWIPLPAASLRPAYYPPLSHLRVVLSTPPSRFVTRKCGMWSPSSYSHLTVCATRGHARIRIVCQSGYETKNERARVRAGICRSLLGSWSSVFCAHSSVPIHRSAS
jgi:hypothetical protein